MSNNQIKQLEGAYTKCIASENSLFENFSPFFEGAQDDLTVEVLVTCLQSTFEDDSQKPTQKYYALSLLKLCLSTKSSKLAQATASKLLSILGLFAQHNLGSTEPNRGATLFGGQDKQVSNDFFILVLESIKVWPMIFPEITRFQRVFSKLHKGGVVFPDKLDNYAQEIQDLKNGSPGKDRGTPQPEQQSHQSQHQQLHQQQQQPPSQRISSRNEFETPTDHPPEIDADTAEQIKKLSKFLSIIDNNLVAFDSIDLTEESIPYCLERIEPLKRQNGKISEALFEQVLSLPQSPQTEILQKKLFDVKELLESSLSDIQSATPKNILKKLKSMKAKTQAYFQNFGIQSNAPARPPSNSQQQHLPMPSGHLSFQQPAGNSRSQQNLDFTQANPVIPPSQLDVFTEYGGFVGQGQDFAAVPAGGHPASMTTLRPTQDSYPQHQAFPSVAGGPMNQQSNAGNMGGGGSANPFDTNSDTKSDQANQNPWESRRDTQQQLPQDQYNPSRNNINNMQNQNPFESEEQSSYSRQQGYNNPRLNSLEDNGNGHNYGNQNPFGNDAARQPTQQLNPFDQSIQADNQAGNPFDSSPSQLPQTRRDEPEFHNQDQSNYQMRSNNLNQGNDFWDNATSNAAVAAPVDFNNMSAPHPNDQQNGSMQDQLQQPQEHHGYDNSNYMNQYRQDNLGNSQNNPNASSYGHNQRRKESNDPAAGGVYNLTDSQYNAATAYNRSNTRFNEWKQEQEYYKPNHYESSDNAHFNNQGSTAWKPSYNDQPTYDPNQAYGTDDVPHQADYAADHASRRVDSEHHFEQDHYQHHQPQQEQTVQPKNNESDDWGMGGNNSFNQAQPAGQGLAFEDFASAKPPAEEQQHFQEPSHQQEFGHQGHWGDTHFDQAQNQSQSGGGVPATQNTAGFSGWDNDFYAQAQQNNPQDQECRYSDHNWNQPHSEHEQSKAGTQPPAPQQNWNDDFDFFGGTSTTPPPAAVAQPTNSNNQGFGFGFEEQAEQQNNFGNSGGSVPYQSNKPSASNHNFFDDEDTHPTSINAISQQPQQQQLNRGDGDQQSKHWFGDFPETNATYDPNNQPNGQAPNNHSFFDQNHPQTFDFQHQQQQFNQPQQVDLFGDEFGNPSSYQQNGQHNSHLPPSSAKNVDFFNSQSGAPDGPAPTRVATAVIKSASAHSYPAYQKGFIMIRDSEVQSANEFDVSEFRTAGGAPASGAPYGTPSSYRILEVSPDIKRRNEEFYDALSKEESLKQFVEESRKELVMLKALAGKGASQTLQASRKLELLNAFQIAFIDKQDLPESMMSLSANSQSQPHAMNAAFSGGNPSPKMQHITFSHLKQPAESKHDFSIKQNLINAEQKSLLVKELKDVHEKLFAMEQVMAAHATRIFLTFKDLTIHTGLTRNWNNGTSRTKRYVGVQVKTNK